MAEDYNINIRNGMGGGGKSTAQRKISAKASIARAKETIQNTGLVKKSLGVVSKGVSVATGSGGSSSGLLSSVGGKASAILGTVIVVAEKIANYGINSREAESGNQLASHNERNTLRTITSLGMNYMVGQIQNELFTKKNHKPTKLRFGLWA